MLDLISAFLVAIRVFFRSRLDTSLEILALRQQVAVLKRKRPRPPLTPFDRLFWATLRQLWPQCSDVLAIVKPETVVGWHRAGFRLYWRWRSRQTMAGLPRQPSRGNRRNGFRYRTHFDLQTPVLLFRY
jgi:putative transposase